MADRKRSRRRRPRDPLARVDLSPLRRFRSRLLSWYAAEGRDLPWRRTTDPYRILVSEVMLQQTQVTRVIGFYREFLRRFPSMKRLDQAPLPAVRRIMDPLGYKRRSGYLKSAAREVRASYNGRFPTDEREIRALPGVGRYTAGAIRSFAWNHHAPVCDTNVARVLTRVFLGRDRPRKPGGDRRLWALAERVIAPGRAREFNNALMDLGALICVAIRPRCRACPMRRGVCAAHARDAVEPRTP